MRSTENKADNKVHFLEKYTKQIISLDKKAGKLQYWKSHTSLLEEMQCNFCNEH